MKKEGRKKDKNTNSMPSTPEKKNEETLPNLFSKASITLIPKADKNQFILKKTITD